jgi:hypothetical protein
MNQGTAGAPDLAAGVRVNVGGAAFTVSSGRSCPTLADLDRDGLADLVLGNTEGQLVLCRNTGTPGAPQFAAPALLAVGGVAVDLTGTPRSRPFATDLDADGLPDLLVGAADGVVRRYEVAAPAAGPGLSVAFVVETPPATLAGAALFADAGLTVPGLVGSYVNRSLEAVTVADDWRTTQEISGSRTDATLAFTTASWGARAAVGVTGGSDADWESFSVQWDGWLQVTQAGQRVFTASDDGSRLWIDVDGDGVFAPTELLDNGWGRSQGVTSGERSAGLPAGAYRIRIQYYEIGGGNEFYLVSSTWVPRQFEAAPGNPRQTIRVLVLNFEPRIPSEGNRRLWEVFGWNDPRRLATQFAADTAFMTGGAVAVEIVEWRHLDAFPLFSDGFRYAPEQYVQNRRTNSGWHSGSADFYHLAREQGLAELVNTDRIDEIWCFGDHYFGLFGEAWMAGPNSFFINGPSFTDCGFDRAVAGYGFNYERGVAEMVHDLGHRTENHGQRAYGSWDLANPVTAFDRFSANTLESPGQTAGVGTCHVPANADAHYDYGDPRVVESTALDWANYPNLTGATTAVSRDTWGSGPAADDHRDYMNFYFGMMPRQAGTAPDGRQANWFKYIWDFNSYAEGTGLPREEAAFGAGATITRPGGTAQRFTVRYYDTTGIDTATLGNGNTEVHGPGGFVQGATLVSVGAERATTAGSARTVTYAVAAPGGTWDGNDAGSYRIVVRPDQVRDTAGNAVSGGEVGRFLVSIPAASVLGVAAKLANGQATVSHTAIDIGPITNLFDGSVDTLVRTPDIDPAVVTLSFVEAQTLYGFTLYVTYASGDPACIWQIETADTLADLDSRSGSWRQAVPPTGTTAERTSRVDLVAPLSARLVRLTATKLEGDDYVHLNEWQLLGPPSGDTTPPAASLASPPDVTSPGGTAQFLTVTYSDASGVDVTSLGTGDLLVSGPDGFSATAVFYAVDDYFAGSPRTATYWLVPPGGSWDSTDNGTYTCALVAAQVGDTAGNDAPAQTLGNWSVDIPAPVRRPPADLAEENAALWLAGAEGGTASTSADSTRRVAGLSSIRFETDGGFDTWLRFPPADYADWDLTGASHLHFSVFAENNNSPQFQSNSPWIRLRDVNGGWFEYRFYQGGDQADPLNSALGEWHEFTVPLQAGGAVNDGWRRTVSGAPSFDHIASLEFHADTWGSGFKLWYDAVGFDLPTAQTIDFAALAARTYGEAPFALAATATSGLPVSYASSAEAVATVSGTTVTIIGAGTTTITACQAGGAAWSAAVSVPQTLTVNRAPLTLTADSALRRVGQPNPVFTGTATGLQNGDTLATICLSASYTCPADDASPPGDYPITPAGPAATTNYAVAYAAGTLTIVLGSLHTVTFLAGANGSIAGTTPQSVLTGDSTTPVTAVAAYGYVFQQWSDGSTANPRAETNVAGDRTFTAEFRPAGRADPTGDFLARVEAAGVTAGHGLWDLTGSYTIAVAGNPLTLDLVHDAQGKLTGVATYTVPLATPLTMPVRGQVRGAGGNVALTSHFRGADPAGTVRVSLALNLTVDTPSRQLTGRLIGSVEVNGVKTPVAQAVTLAIAAPMDGTWTLQVDLLQDGRRIAGTGTLTLSNGVENHFALSGRTAGALAVLNLAGQPLDPLSKGVTLRPTLETLEGHQARFTALSGRGYGQTLSW